jgi:DNA-binding transcriptional MerR regulator
MLSTKEFANLCSTSKKTILHYHKIGLLKPAQQNGLNRLYEPKQVLLFQKIFMLKSFGFSLEEIKNLLNEKDLQSVFSQKKQKLADQQKTLQKKLKTINSYLNNFKNQNSFINPKIKTVGPYHIYAMKKVGRYIDINSYDREISQKIGDKNYKKVYLTIFNTQAYAPQKSDMLVGAIMGKSNLEPIEGLKIIKIPKQKVLVYTHIGSYKYMSFFWQFIIETFHKKKLKPNPDFPNRELYLHGELANFSEDDLVTELQIPIL